jgi:hypothetical protein
MEEQSHRTWGNLLEDEAYRSLHQSAARGPYQFQRGTARGSVRTSNLKHIILCTMLPRYKQGTSYMLRLVVYFYTTLIFFK